MGDDSLLIEPVAYHTCTEEVALGTVAMFKIAREGCRLESIHQLIYFSKEYEFKQNTKRVESAGSTHCVLEPDGCCLT